MRRKRHAIHARRGDLHPLGRKRVVIGKSCV